MQVYRRDRSDLGFHEREHAAWVHFKREEKEVRVASGLTPVLSEENIETFFDWVKNPDNQPEFHKE